MSKIKKVLDELMERRTTQKCYLIYEQSGDFFLVYGTYYKRVIGGNLYDLLMSFHNKKISSWSFVEKRIKRDRDLKPEDVHYQEWKPISAELKREALDIDTFYIDGERKSIQ